jgi:O-antigen ligase
MHYRLSIKSLLLFILLSSTLLIGAYKAIPLFEQRVDAGKADIQKFQDGNYGSSLGLRAAFWIISYDIFKENPLVGVGIGDYRLAAQEALVENDHNFSDVVITWCSNNHFHNQYLMILVQSGLIGFSLFILLFFFFYKLRIDDPEIKELSILFATIYLVSFVAEPLWIKQFPLVLFILFTSLFIASERVND